jgi:hypothetical protein
MKIVNKYYFKYILLFSVLVVLFLLIYKKILMYLLFNDFFTKQDKSDFINKTYKINKFYINKYESFFNKYNYCNNNNFSEAQCSLLYSIIIRIEYGCNKSDDKMLNDIAHIWYKRILDNNNNNNIKVNTLNITPIVVYVKELLLDDWDISAIDYHNNTKLLEYINKKYDITIEILKEIIFHHSSNINYRCKPHIYDIKNWNIIKNYVEKTQKYLLNSSY